MSLKDLPDKEQTFNMILDAVQYGLNSEWAYLRPAAPFRHFSAHPESNSLILRVDENGKYKWVEGYAEMDSVNKALKDWYENYDDPNSAMKKLKILKAKVKKLLEAERRIATPFMNNFSKNH